MKIRAMKDRNNMAKRNGNQETLTEPKNVSTGHTSLMGTSSKPSGYEKQSDDVEGYWSGKAPIHCIPRSARLFDGSIDATKPSVLLIVQLVTACEVYTKEAGQEETHEAPAGSMVGVWGKPGMRSIRNLAGAKVYMFQSGEKDTGKGNPMKLFHVSSEPGGAAKGKPIPITEDTRVKSRGASTFLTQSTIPDGDSPESTAD